MYLCVYTCCLAASLPLSTSLTLSLPLSVFVCLRAAVEKCELKCRTAAALNWKYSTNRSNVQFAQTHTHTHTLTHTLALRATPRLKCNGRHFEFNCGQRWKNCANSQKCCPKLRKLHYSFPLSLSFSFSLSLSILLFRCSHC